MPTREILEKYLEDVGRTLVLVLVLLVGVEFSAAADSPELKPFHLIFNKYVLNSSDGTYTFYFEFLDVPRPHVQWPGDAGPKNEFKIGDVIGKYKITSFKTKIVPATGEMFAPLDASQITLQNVEKPGELMQIIFRKEYNVPEAAPSANKQ